MNRFELLGLSLLGFGSALGSASYWLLSNVPLTALGIGVAVLGASIP